MTLSAAEKNAIVDGIFEVAGEDYTVAARILRLLNAKAASQGWTALMRTRAALWAPYISSGLSVTWWCDEVVRLAV